MKVSGYILRLLKTGLLSCAILVLGSFLGFVWAHYLPRSIRTWAPKVQIISGVFILWALLAVLGWKIQTWGGNSNVEKTELWTFRILNCFGMLLLFTSSTALVWLGDN